MILFPQFFGLGSWKFGNLLDRKGNENIYLEGIYRTSAGSLVALDGEQPAQECLVIQERSRGIARFCGCYKVLGLLEVGTCMVTVRV